MNPARDPVRPQPRRRWHPPPSLPADGPPHLAHGLARRARLDALVPPLGVRAQGPARRRTGPLGRRRPAVRAGRPARTLGLITPGAGISRSAAFPATGP